MLIKLEQVLQADTLSDTTQYIHSSINTSAWHNTNQLVCLPSLPRKSSMNIALGKELNAFEKDWKII